MFTLELSSYVLEIGNPDWLFYTQSGMLQIDWLILENNENAILNVNVPYWIAITSNLIQFGVRAL